MHCSDDVSKYIYTKEDLVIRMDDISNMSIDIVLLEKNPNFKEQLMKLKKKREKAIDCKKLRRTVIYGLPCEYHVEGPGIKKNLRAFVWKQFTNIDEFKKEMIEDYN